MKEKGNTATWIISMAIAGLIISVIASSQFCGQDGNSSEDINYDSLEESSIIPKTAINYPNRYIGEEVDNYIGEEITIKGKVLSIGNADEFYEQQQKYHNYAENAIWRPMLDPLEPVNIVGPENAVISLYLLDNVRRETKLFVSGKYYFTGILVGTEALEEKILICDSISSVALAVRKIEPQ